MIYQYLSPMPLKALVTRPLDSVSLIQSFEHPLMPLGVPDIASLIKTLSLRLVMPARKLFYVDNSL